MGENGWQKKALGVCGLTLVLASITLFGICMGSYVHLGPDDQVLLKRATGKYVKNGPWEGQLHPFHEKTRRKAELLDPLQYAVVQDILTSIMRTEIGPKLLFLGPYDELKSTNQKIVLENHEYVVLNDHLTGAERVVRGPDTVVPEVTETYEGIQSAVFVNLGTAVVTRNKFTGLLALITSCSNPSGVWFPQPLDEVVDIRELIHVLPHEAMVVRDVDGRTTVYSGREAQSSGDGQCRSADNSGVGGTAFFLPPSSKIVRMRWSVYRNGNEELADPTPEPAPAPETGATTTPPAPSPTPAPTPKPAPASATGASTTPPAPSPTPAPRPTPKPGRRLYDEATPQEAAPLADGEDETEEYHQRGLFDRRLSREEVYVFDSESRERRLESIYVDQTASSTQTGPTRLITSIDMRTQKSFYSYEVRTNDNVRLLMEGTIFWRIQDVRKMLNMTSDPEADVWFKSRSVLVASLSEVDLATFMVSFNTIVLNAFDNSKNSAFWSDRGIRMISIELNNYRPVDLRTAATLQSMIRGTVQRINDLQKQRSSNDVMKEKLEADIMLERNQTLLIEQQAVNAIIVAATAGATEGGRKATTISSFMDLLNLTLTNSTERLELYRQQKLLDSAQIDTEHLTQGNASLYLSPKDVALRLQMPSHGPEL
mmetsp:Transcript_102748/g.329456  ORF Transcript_102748/g.329456 Transcript_102748/m.329456 type:complete len:655 (-) Transcript_102748:112-2076(-)